MNQEPVESERLTGIAKKFNKELEELPFESHAAIIGILGCLVQHRQAVIRGRQEEAMRKAQLAEHFSVPTEFAVKPQ